MKIKFLATISICAAIVLSNILPRTAYAFSIVPDKCITSKTGCDACDVILILTNVSTIITGLLGSIALLMFVVGGLFWILSNGNEQRIESGKKILTSTITGLAIVMLAWISINFVVRLANQANTGTTDTKIFSKDWWAPTCTSSVKTCAGAIIGDACGTVGDCKDNKDDAPCSCFRNQKPEGDFGVCGSTDATSADAAAGSYENCYCADQCSQLNYREGYTSWKWSCVDKTKVVAGSETATAAGVPCPTAGEICVGEQH